MLFEDQREDLGPVPAPAHRRGVIDGLVLADGGVWPVVGFADEPLREWLGEEGHGDPPRLCRGVSEDGTLVLDVPDPERDFWLSELHDHPIDEPTLEELAELEEIEFLPGRGRP